MQQYTIKELINKGYYLSEIKYNNDVKFYKLIKDTKKNQYYTIAEFCIITGNKLAKKYNIKIKKTNKITTAINFSPVAPKLNHIRTFY